MTLHADLPSVFDDGELYDLVLADIPFGLDFYTRIAVESGGPVLDIACGTGRILLPLLQQGVDIQGIDLFEPMLRQLRRKGSVLGLLPNVERADMSDFRCSRKFQLIMIPFNAFIHNMSQATQIRCLERCREHLLPGGRLVFDTFFPGLDVVGTAPDTRVFEGEFPHPQTGLPIRMYDTRTFDRVAQTQYSICELELLDEEATCRPLTARKSALDTFTSMKQSCFCELPDLTVGKSREISKVDRSTMKGSQ